MKADTSPRSRKPAKAERKVKAKRGEAEVQYVVYLPSLKPTHLTAKQAEKAVDYAIAARRSLP